MSGGRVVVLLALLSLMPAVAVAQTPAQKRPDCTAAEHRQFDFWLGAWEVTEKGKSAGTNRIESDLNGCVLIEHWTSASDGRGTSLNFYDRDTKAWYQTWVDGSGGALCLKGGVMDGRMRMQTQPAAGATAVERITWSQEPDGSVRQLWESSRDGGTTWTTAFDGRYVKSK